MIARRFEDRILRQRSRELTRLIYSYTKTGKFKMDFGLVDQMPRSRVSVMSNIADGFGRGSNKELIQFLFVAKGSLSEVQPQLYVALDQGYIDGVAFKNANAQSQEVSRLINTFVKSINRGTRKGFKN